jgi:oxygen-dependent protoporphyrinogen oxidase
MTIDVTVIGGGVSGLSAAHALIRLGYKVAVLERQVRVGGKAYSERIGGFLMEHGPSSLVAEGAGLSLPADLGLDHVRVELGAGVQRRYIVADRRLHGIAIHPAAFVTSRFLSGAGRLRLLAEALMPGRASAAEETVAAFCRRRFGREFTDRVIDSLVCGMFAGRAEQLSMAATFPRLVEMERTYGSILRAVIRGRLSGKQMPARRLFSWRDGVGTLPTVLAQQLGAHVRTGVTVRSIVKHRRGFLVKTVGDGDLESKAVIIATQPHVAATLLERIDSEAACATARIDTPPLAVVFLGYAREQIGHPLDSIGYLVPGSERRPVNGALFGSTMFPERAPRGFVALTAYFGGDRAPQLARLPADELIGLAQREFGELLGAKGDPVLARVRHWPCGLPQYRMGHRDLVGILDGLSQRRPGLYVTGNYAAGVSVAACAAHAAQISMRVDDFLRQDAPDSAVHNLETLAPANNSDAPAALRRTIPESGGAIADSSENNRQARRAS